MPHAQADAPFNRFTSAFDFAGPMITGQAGLCCGALPEKVFGSPVLYRHAETRDAGRSWRRTIMASRHCPWPVTHSGDCSGSERCRILRPRSHRRACPDCRGLRHPHRAAPPSLGRSPSAAAATGAAWWACRVTPSADVLGWLRAPCGRSRRRLGHGGAGGWLNASIQPEGQARVRSRIEKPMRRQERRRPVRPEPMPCRPDRRPGSSQEAGARRERRSGTPAPAGQPRGRGGAGATPRP